LNASAATITQEPKNPSPSIGPTSEKSIYTIPQVASQPSELEKATIAIIENKENLSQAQAKIVEAAGEVQKAQAQLTL
jgi:hypothetical protein